MPEGFGDTNVRELNLKNYALSNGKVLNKDKQECAFHHKPYIILLQELKSTKKLRGSIRWDEFLIPVDDAKEDLVIICKEEVKAQAFEWELSFLTIRIKDLCIINVYRPQNIFDKKNNFTRFDQIHSKKSYILWKLGYDIR